MQQYLAMFSTGPTLVEPQTRHVNTLTGHVSTPKATVYSTRLPCYSCNTASQRLHETNTNYHASSPRASIRGVRPVLGREKERQHFDCENQRSIISRRRKIQPAEGFTSLSLATKNTPPDLRWSYTTKRTYLYPTSIYQHLTYTYDTSRVFTTKARREQR